MSEADDRGSQISNVIDGAALKDSPNIIDRQEDVGRDMKSANFFQMSGIPKFGKNWLDNFIPDEEM